MRLRDFMNVQRVYRTLSAKWGCPIWMVKKMIRHTIEKGWEKAQADSEAKSLWDKYFPLGKPTPNQYIERLGHARENKENIPFFFYE